jgi:hypothetical protein
MMPVPAMLGAACAALLLVFAPQARAQACACQDLADLRNRMCEARAAVAEYGKQIQLIRAQETKTGTPVMYTMERYKAEVQPCVQEAINQVTDSNANRPTGDTNNACEITYKGNPTACLKEVLTSHESIHVTVCKAWSNDRDKEGFFASLRGLFTDFRDGSTLIDLLNEERTAYQTEMNHVRDEIVRLSRSRPPCPGMPVEPPGPPRIPTIEPCPPPKPRPAPQDSYCRHR